MKSTALRLSGAEVRVGDEFSALWFMRGCPGVVKELRRYSGPLLDVLGEGTQIASFVGSSIETTLPAREWFDVTRMQAGAA